MLNTWLRYKEIFFLIPTSKIISIFMMYFLHEYTLLSMLNNIFQRRWNNNAIITKKLARFHICEAKLQCCAKAILFFACMYILLGLPNFRITTTYKIKTLLFSYSNFNKSSKFSNIRQIFFIKSSEICLSILLILMTYALHLQHL